MLSLLRINQRSAPKPSLCCHPSLSPRSLLGSPLGWNNLDSPSPLLLGWAELGCDSPSTHTAAPHTSADLTHCSLSLAGASLSLCHPLPPLSGWLAPPATVLPQLWSLRASVSSSELGRDLRLHQRKRDCGTTGTCLSSLLLALLGESCFSGLRILSSKMNNYYHLLSTYCVLGTHYAIVG